MRNKQTEDIDCWLRCPVCMSISHPLHWFITHTRMFAWYTVYCCIINLSNILRRDSACMEVHRHRHRWRIIAKQLLCPYRPQWMALSQTQNACHRRCRMLRLFIVTWTNGRLLRFRHASSVICQTAEIMLKAIPFSGFIFFLHAQKCLVNTHDELDTAVLNWNEKKYIFKEH